MKLLPPPLLLHQVSKLRNWIASPILDGSSSSKLDIKGVFYSFKTPPRTSKTTQYSYNKWSYFLHLSCCFKCQNSEIELQAQYLTDPQALSWTLKVWFVALRCPQRTSKTTQYSYNKWFINKWSYSLHLSCCIKCQNSKIELQAQYSTDSQALSWTLKVWFIALRRPQERPKRPIIHIINEVTSSTSPVASSVKTPKLNCKPNTQRILKL